jgi:hypothetical protein
MEKENRKQVAQPEPKPVLADSADLISRDMSRCNDYRCPTAPFCERRIQMSIDYAKGDTTAPVTDFKGRERSGLCDYFLNIDVV